MSARSTRGPRREPPTMSWDPLRDLLSLKERMNRLFETVLRKGGDLAKGEAAGWNPAVDFREDREGFLLSAELPGVPRDSIAVTVEDGILTLRGVRPLDTSRDAEHLRVERSHGPFLRTFHLPVPIDQSKIRARFHLGVLEVLLPRSPEARAAPVKVRVV